MRSLRAWTSNCVEIDVNVNDPSFSGGTIIGESLRRADGYVPGASIASTLWLNLRLRTGWLIWPLSIHHSPSRVRPVITMVRGSTSRTYPEPRDQQAARCGLDHLVQRHCRLRAFKDVIDGPGRWRPLLCSAQ